ncbi:MULTISPECIES: DUF4229 domain-containing protein [unclassified Cryobacterium]|uniref:DUF4229 domain-containing protein n=2 Tax=Cryobacterium TaxID=69578 RepID=UPI002AB5ACD2|nr:MULTISPECIES: DUF4229 domain-containing protein [unclassified Cryobacterium]MDY7541858.1 DUF4229 domain-containing protein [Cryobacterium sp. 5B3]MEB0000942.1 DUF4229 domain-containing protein [Cryobacterium sp. RTS3]MEB0274212.1 DUF4229 domain-containing protein [Cryobacterium sp. 5B3]
MKAVPSWLSYSVFRILMFAVPLAVLLMLSIVWWVSAIVAALIGLCLSYIFLRKPREQVALDLYTARHPTAEVVHPDAESEDAALDRAADAAAASAEAASAEATDAAAQSTTPAAASAAPVTTAASAASPTSERESSAQ